MATPKFRRGQVVERPDKWEIKGRYKQGKAIVMSATTRDVVLCTFHATTSGEPHLGHYAPDGLKVIGKVKRIPTACKDVLKWKKEFWKKEPYFKKPHNLKTGTR